MATATASKPAKKTAKKATVTKVADPKAINLRPELHPASHFKEKKPEFAEIKLVKFGVDGTPALTIEESTEFLKCNLNNRPEKSSALNRYANDMLRKKWRAGEPLLFSDHGVLLDGQNRLKAHLLAEKLRLKDPQMYREKYGWRGPITIPMLVIIGIPARDIDSINTGERRTAPDVLYRQQLFDGYKMADKTPEFKNNDKKKLAKILGTAVRTVWLRVGGKDVSDAPKFQHSELLEFLDKHPKIVDMVVEVYRNEDGAERQITSLCSPAFVAAVAYLGAAEGSNRNKYDSTSEVKITDKSWKTAVDFVESFASGAGLTKGDPILVCRNILLKQSAEGGSKDRDTLLNTLVKTWNAYSEGVTETTTKAILPGKDEVCRIGGLDVEDEPVAAVDNAVEEDTTEVESNGEATDE